jgi:hypothetical protein
VLLNCNKYVAKKLLFCGIKQLTPIRFMKKLHLTMAALVCMAGISCSDDDSSFTNNNSTDIAAVITTATSGTWKITSFTEDANDETAHFTGYNFTYGSNGALTAANGTNTYTGAWLVTDNSNSTDDDDSGSNDIDFNIAFTAPDDFTELTEDWHIQERTASTIKLVHVSGGNGGTDYLTFEKN